MEASDQLNDEVNVLKGQHSTNIEFYILPKIVFKIKKK